MMKVGIFLGIFDGLGMKLLTVEKSFAEKHYADLSAKPFFPGLVEYIVSGPVVAMVWEGKNVVVTGRKIIGATNPSDSAPGTIRGDLAIEVGRWDFNHLCIFAHALAFIILNSVDLVLFCTLWEKMRKQCLDERIDIAKILVPFIEMVLFFPIYTCFTEEIKKEIAL